MRVSDTYLQRLAALIPHQHVGGHYCSSCGLAEAAPVHHWDERPTRAPWPPQPPQNGAARLHDGDDATGRGAAEDAYQTVLTGERP